VLSKCLNLWAAKWQQVILIQKMSRLIGQLPSNCSIAHLCLYLVNLIDKIQAKETIEHPVHVKPINLVCYYTSTRQYGTPFIVYTVTVFYQLAVATTTCPPTKRQP